jgi:hypothetical protein
MSTAKDPMRLVLDPSCPESDRELLRLGTNIAPPRDAEARVWQAVIGVVGTGAAAGTGGLADAPPRTTTVTSAGKANAAGLTGVKVALILGALAALAALVVLGSYLLTPARSPQPPIAVAPPPAPAPLPAPAPPPAPAVAGPPAPKPGLRSHTRVAAAASSASSSASRLREETGLLSEARQALREGEAARALRLLEESRRRFPAGVLEQERERLTIEALLKDGRSAQASSRGAEFLRKHPDSPHAAAIRRLVPDATGKQP